MDWFDILLWVLAGCGVGLGVYAVAKGILPLDKFVAFAAAVVALVKKAESEFPAPGMGAVKKETVMEVLNVGEDDVIVSSLIDIVVAFYNKHGWKK